MRTEASDDSKELGIGFCEFESECTIEEKTLTDQAKECEAMNMFAVLYGQEARVPIDSICGWFDGITPSQRLIVTIKVIRRPEGFTLDTLW